jgi:Zn-dependent protease with chaperone function
MMDFFANQDRARRHTARLVWLFAAAVVALVLGVNLVAAIAASRIPAWHAHPAAVHIWVTVATLGIIAAGSAWKTAELAAGGRAVAAMLGGREISAGSVDPAERRLINVVEEMAIASGVPMPAVFILDDRSINAFAAGHNPRDAAVAVTRGCIETLSRDELQGVVAHEFSHLLNGDMRLNLRLIGLLHGILILALTGQILMRFGGNAGYVVAVDDDRRDRDRGNAQGLAIAMFLGGLALLIIGYAGYFLGGLIKAAVSRQREFLADASAVQFTRNPGGIGGALKKIGAGSAGSFVNHARANEVSHLFFANGVGASFSDMLATHPPIAERVRAIDPQWDGTWPATALSADSAADDAASSAGATAVAGIPFQTATRPLDQPAVRPVGRAAFTPRVADASAPKPDLTAARVGHVAPEHVAWSANLLAAIPPAIGAAARETFGARAILISLLLDTDPAKAARQHALVAQADPGLARELARLAQPVQNLGESARLPLSTLAINALRQLSARQAQDFVKLLHAVIRADNVITLGEYSLVRLVEANLFPQHARQASIFALHPLRDALALVLSELANEGATDPAQARSAFAAGCAALGADLQLTLLPAGSIDPGHLDRALTTLDQASAAIKRQVINACAACIADDGNVTAREAELLRLIADCLGCPLPPFVVGAAQS